jgi:hypothetical protein
MNEKALDDSHCRKSAELLGDAIAPPAGTHSGLAYRFSFRGENLHHFCGNIVGGKSTSFSELL